MASLGIIGLGLVGSAIAERLLAASHQVVGFDIAAQRSAEFTATGGSACATPAEVFEATNCVFLSLPTSDVVEGLLESLPANLAGKTIVDTTTGEPEAMGRIGNSFAQRNADYFVATIAGSSTQVRRGEVIVMTGGADDVATRVDVLLQAFSKQRVHVGSWSAAARMKLVVNLVLGLNRAVLAEGLAFAKACGIEPRKALEVLQAGPAFSRVMETKGERMVTGNFAPEARLAQHAKDVRLILEQGGEFGARLPLSELHSQLLGELIAQGWGEQDNSAIWHSFDAPPKEPR